MPLTEGTRQITIQLELPASVPLNEEQMREMLILKLVELGVLSQSEGAKALGISRAELIERMTQLNIPVVRYTREDLEHEKETLQWLHLQRCLPK